MVNLSIREFKSAADMLGRFANIRDGAPEPTDRILIQFDQVLKFVAGDDLSTVILDSGAPVDGTGKALVSSRLLLQAAKTLRGKGDVSISLDGKGGALLTTNTGGRVTLPRFHDELPGWVRQSKEDASAVALELPAGFWPDLSSLVALGPEKLYGWEAEVHFIHRHGGLRLVWTDNYRWVEAPLVGVPLRDWVYLGSTPASFIKSLKAFDGSTGMVLTGDRVEVYSGQSAAVSGLRNISREKQRLDRFPEPDEQGGEYVTFSLPRADFIDNIKAVASADAHGRVTVMVNPGEVKVYGYGLEREGSMTMKTSVTQRGFISFKAELATRLLSGIKDKEVTFSFPARGGGLIRVKESKWGWRMLLAPIAL